MIISIDELKVTLFQNMCFASKCNRNVPILIPKEDINGTGFEEHNTRIHKYYYKDGKIFLTEDYSGKYWYKGFNLHRVGGPAIERRDGSKEWWVDGQRHREDGPAIISVNGNKEWWINGVFKEKE